MSGRTFNPTPDKVYRDPTHLRIGDLLKIGDMEWKFTGSKPHDGQTLYRFDRNDVSRLFAAEELLALAEKDFLWTMVPTRIKFDDRPANVRDRVILPSAAGR
jgi:hypothetical protein